MSYTSAYSPKTFRVTLSPAISGVPVKPTKVALGSASRIHFAPPSTNPYWLRCASSAITTTFDRSLILPWVSVNLWIVVKTTPPDARSSRVFKCARLSAITGSCRSNPRPIAKVSNSCTSRSLRSVTITSVGLAISAARTSAPASISIVRLLPDPCVCHTTPPCPFVPSPAGRGLG